MPKALVHFQGRLLVERGLSIMVAADLDPRVIVLGAAAAEVRSVARMAEAELVENPEWATGIAGSLRVGLETLASRVDAVVVLLVDQPLIGVDVISRLVSAWRDGAEIAVATYQGQPGNPVLFDAALGPAISSSVRGDVGARSFMQSHEDLVVHVPCDDVGCPDDIDSVDDLVRLNASAWEPAPRPS